MRIQRGLSSRGVSDPLFDRARVDDPDTSKQAAAFVTDTGLATAQQAVVWELVRGNNGMTARELATVGLQLAHEVLHKRLPEVARKGMIRKGRVRKCNVTGRNAATWWMT